MVEGASGTIWWIERKIGGTKEVSGVNKSELTAKGNSRRCRYIEFFPFFRVHELGVLVRCLKCVFNFQIG